jgi:uncharacterized protein
MSTKTSVQQLPMRGALSNTTSHSRVAVRTYSAETTVSRLKGLLGASGLEAESCLWIHDCRSIHTYFMKFAIDVVFVDKNLRVKKIYRSLKPWSLTMPVMGARSVFEFQSGALNQVQISVGDQLHVGN